MKNLVSCPSELKMYRLLSVCKMMIFMLVLFRTFRDNPPSIPLLVVTCLLVINSFSRNIFNYEKSKINNISLHLDLLLALVFSLFTRGGSFDKFFAVCAFEGTAVLPKPYYLFYLALTIGMDAISYAIFNLRMSEPLQYPGIAEILLFAVIIVVISSERRQREQRIANEKLVKELRYINLQLRESMAWSESLASDMERQRIMGEIHDNLGHDLTALIITLEAGKKVKEDLGKSLEYWDKALQVSRKALNSVRELVSSSQAVSAEFDLLTRVNEMVTEVGDLTGLRIELKVLSDDIVASEKEQLNIYRILQEAITNTLRHSNADQAVITITGNQQLLAFSYTDNGMGTEQIRSGNGLKGMMARMSDLNGTINFKSGLGMGFIIEGSIDKRGTRNEQNTYSNS